MARFAVFVDGSNMFGALKKMNVEVKEYDKLYAYIFREAHSEWLRVTQQTGKGESELRRIYWYVVGSIDEWELGKPQSQDALRAAFNKDKQTRDYWYASAGKANAGLKGDKLNEKAWVMCFDDFKEWYDAKLQTLDGMRDFYQGIRISTDLIDVLEHGHWKVNFLRKYVDEKGLDTSLAVDMVALQDNYDVAVVISGDADSIPSIRHLKKKDKIIAAVEFVNGSPPEQKGRTFSSRLREHADFVLRIYETELILKKLAKRPAILP
jgi:uncharacterized LabA/DUF88 family protein